MALRVLLCRTGELREGALTSFAVRGVTWPVLAGVFGGEVIATAGVCPHEDVLLADGELDGTCLTCPGHGYQFDLTSGACRHDRSLSLRRYPVTLVADQVWIDLLA